MTLKVPCLYLVANKQQQACTKLQDARARTHVKCSQSTKERLSHDMWISNRRQHKCHGSELEETHFGESGGERRWSRVLKGDHSLGNVCILKHSQRCALEFPQHSHISQGLDKFTASDKSSWSLISHLWAWGPLRCSFQENVTLWDLMWCQLGISLLFCQSEL